MTSRILQSTTQEHLKLILSILERLNIKESYSWLWAIGLATANLQQLEKLCWMGCDAYNDLKASIEDYQKGKKIDR